jgi:hypothetical protein
LDGKVPLNLHLASYAILHVLVLTVAAAEKTWTSGPGERISRREHNNEGRLDGVTVEKSGAARAGVWLWMGTARTACNQPDQKSATSSFLPLPTND